MRGATRIHGKPSEKEGRGLREQVAERPPGQEKDSRELATEIAGVLIQGKAKDVAVLDVRGITLISDCFVIASGRSSTQVKALARRILENVETKRRVHVEGQDLGVWVLIDYGDVIVHVFRDTERSFYGLERLWGDAGKIEFREDFNPAEARLQ